MLLVCLNKGHIVICSNEKPFGMISEKWIKYWASIIDAAF